MLCLIGGFMFLQACNDECEGVTCNNGGVCDDGTCQCDEGYTGSSCDDEQRAGLVGTWIGNSICDTEPATATTVIILEGTSVSEIVLTQVGIENLNATITGVNTFDIEPFIDTTGSLDITTIGNGSINENGQVVINYNQEVEGIVVETCVFTGAQ